MNNDDSCFGCSCSQNWHQNHTRYKIYDYLPRLFIVMLSTPSQYLKIILFRRSYALHTKRSLERDKIDKNFIKNGRQSGILHRVPGSTIHWKYGQHAVIVSDDLFIFLRSRTRWRPPATLASTATSKAILPRFDLGNKLFIIFLAVQDSSIGDIVTEWVSEWVSEWVTLFD